MKSFARPANVHSARNQQLCLQAVLRHSTLSAMPSTSTLSIIRKSILYLGAAQHEHATDASALLIYLDSTSYSFLETACPSLDGSNLLEPDEWSAGHGGAAAKSVAYIYICKRRELAHHLRLLSSAPALGFSFVSKQRHLFRHEPPRCRAAVSRHC